MTKNYILIDASGFIFRAYHALPPLTNHKGEPIGAVMGFINMLMKVQAEHVENPVVVIFDAARHTFRNQIYAEYKAHRPPPPDDLIPQFLLVREAVRALSLPVIEMPDYEADDIIATYAQAACGLGAKAIIYSSDKDLMQCINDCVQMFDPVKQKPITAKEVFEKFGVVPDKVLDVLSLIGDTSDNVPGVPSIGPKTAAELIGQFGDLESLLARAGEIKQNKRREVIQAHEKQALLSRDLIRLKCDVPNLPPLESYLPTPLDKAKLKEFLVEHGFSAILRRLEGFAASNQPSALSYKNTAASTTPPAELPAYEANYSLITTEAELLALLVQVKAKGMLAIDTETTGLDAMQASLVGISLCVEPGVAAYIPVGHVRTGDEKPVTESQASLFEASSTSPVIRHPSSLLPGQLPLELVLAHLKPVLADPSILKIAHNLKYDALILERYGCHITPYADTMLMSYSLYGGLHGHGLDELCERYLGHKNITYDEVTGTGKARINFSQVTLENALNYAAEDAAMARQLYDVFTPQLFAARALTLYETIERPLVAVVARMEQAGIKVDRAHLRELSRFFLERMQQLEGQIFGFAGQSFNIGSPKQLGEILFDVLSLPGGKKTKTGAYSTDSFILEELAEQGQEIAAKVIEWRQFSKLKSTYAESLPNQINPQTGRVHTSYSLAATTTGRISSSEPNLQNIPIRTTEGRKLREAFIAEEGHVLISADYSQIELRLLAHMADIPTLKAAFAEGADVHAITASQMFGVAVDGVDAEMRRKAKTINFGIIYGISAHGLAVRLGISRHEAGVYIEQYFAQYPGIRAYMEETKNFAREHGYVLTLYGRRCHVPLIADKNPNKRQFAERAAINAPLQGTAADIIKRAMIGVDSLLTAYYPKSRLLLQVHDELIVEAPEAEAPALAERIKITMQHARQPFGAAAGGSGYRQKLGLCALAGKYRNSIAPVIPNDQREFWDLSQNESRKQIPALGLRLVRDDDKATGGLPVIPKERSDFRDLYQNDTR